MTDDDRIDLAARRLADKLLADGAMGVSIGYLMMQVTELKKTRDAQAARIGTLEARLHALEGRVDKAGVVVAAMQAKGQAKV